MVWDEAEAPTAGGYVALCTTPTGCRSGYVSQDAGGEAAAGARLVRGPEGAVFVADGKGCVWQAEVREGRLLRCGRVTALPPGEVATALQWAPDAGALAVGTDQGRVLLYRCPCCPSCPDSCCSGGCGNSGAGGGSSGSSSGSHGAQGRRLWQLEGELLLDGSVTALCLESGGLMEGVAATSAATAWYLDLAACERVPLVCGHVGRVELVVAAPCVAEGGSRSGDGDAVVASVAADGVLRVWQLGSEQQVREAVGRLGELSRHGGSSKSSAAGAFLVDVC
jgi:hypothetical protein